ncbi:MAG TPA: amino acid adenylation domain-containing protein [Rhodanobacteraceae bacterium]|nr:amino acid adenylation domain-containing protein [Rhodanobacteraceae bacterium]
MSVTVDAALLDQRVEALIGKQAAATPDAVAAICGDRSLTYRELDAQASRVAAHLRARGVEREARVGIFVERSLEMLVAVVAVMKSGAAYVPLDPEFPAERLAHMVADSGLKLVLTQASLVASKPPGSYEALDIAELLRTEAPAPAPAEFAANDLVYVLYTSGSTGKPKGVALEHRNVVNFLLSMQQEPGMVAGDRLLAVTTLSFDIAGLELYLPLVTGATVVIATRDEVVDGSTLRALIDTHRITVMQATPTTWRLLIEAGWQGDASFKVLCGGEALSQDLARQLLTRCGALWNMYGPTETAIWSTCFRVLDASLPVLIGRPIANTGVYVLDKAGRPSPMGVPGELCIAGAGVARGYLDRPELTAERFVRDPFADRFGGRMYRTGDLGRYLPDGNLEFRQRVDNQVKIRGFRVELGDVEAALNSHPQVKQGVARIFELRPGDARLVGYVLPEGEPPTAAELREHLRKTLPQYMVPQHFSVVEQFALTPNGKVDRARLEPPHAADLLAETFVAPSTPHELLVAEVFGDVLQVEKVSADASFFDLGGHSVLAARVVAALRRQGFPTLSLRTLFESPSAATLGRELDRMAAPAVESDTREREEFQF